MVEVGTTYDDFYKELETSLGIQTFNNNDFRGTVRCPRCNNTSVFEPGKKFNCMMCYYEEDGFVDDQAEWRYYGSDDNRGADPSRCGNFINPLMMETSLSTSIGPGYGPAHNRMKMVNIWLSNPPEERTLDKVFRLISINASYVGISQNVINYAQYLFARSAKAQREKFDTQVSRGDVRDGWIAGCLHLACKANGTPRSPVEIAQIMNVDDKDVTRGINLLNKLLDCSELMELNAQGNHFVSYVSRYCSNLVDVDLVLDVSRSVEKLGLLTSCTPMASVAACIYFTSQMHGIGIGKKDISKNCQVSESTITSTYEILIKHTPDIINGLRGRT